MPAWYQHEGFVAANAAHVRDGARQRLPERLRAAARLVFTAHSIPARMAEQSRYREQLAESSRLVAERAGIADWALVYQSRSGRPQDPWLGPDVCDYLRDAQRERAEGRGAVSRSASSAITSRCCTTSITKPPRSRARSGCRWRGRRAVNDDPRFLDMMADVVLATVARHATGRPLPIAHWDEVRGAASAPA